MALDFITGDSLLQFGELIIVLGGAGALIVKAVNTTIRKSSKVIIDDAFKEFSKTLDSQIEELTKKLDEHIKSSNAYNEKIERCLMNNSRERINQAREYYVRQGAISAHTMYTLDELYNSYKELGGNSFICGQMVELHQLPIVGDVCK